MCKVSKESSAAWHYSGPTPTRLVRVQEVAGLLRDVRCTGVHGGVW